LNFILKIFSTLHFQGKNFAVDIFYSLKQKKQNGSTQKGGKKESGEETGQEKGC